MPKITKNLAILQKMQKSVNTKKKKMITFRIDFHFFCKSNKKSLEIYLNKFRSSIKSFTSIFNFTLKFP